MPILLLLFFWSLWYLNYLSRTILSPLLPVIEDSLAINHAMAGGLFLPFYVGSTFSVLVTGVLSNRLGYKKLILLCFIILGLSFITLTFAGSYHIFIVVLFFLGLGSGIYIPCGTPLLTIVVERAHWGKAISIHETAAGFAILTVPFITLLALKVMPWNFLFLSLGMCCLIMTVLIFYRLPDHRPETAESYRVRGLFLRKDFWILTLAFVACGVAGMGIFNIIPLYLVKERGMPMDAANSIFGISRIGGFIAMVVMGFMMDRYSTKKLCFFITLLTGLFTLGIALIHHSQILMIMLFFQATFSVVFFPAGLTAISKVTSQNDRGIFTAVVMSAAGVFGPGLSPIFLGAVADVWSFQAGILIIGILTVICSFGLTLLQDV